MTIFAPAVLGAALLLGIATLPAAASTGIASDYGPGFAGKKTASSERFNPGNMTCAHRSLGRVPIRGVGDQLSPAISG